MTSRGRGAITWRRAIGLCLLALMWAGAVVDVQAAEHSGRVTFHGNPVPGASVTAAHGDRLFTVATDEHGIYRFPDLPDGPCTIQVRIVGFAPEQRDVNIGPASRSLDIQLRLTSVDEIGAGIAIVTAERPASPRLPTVFPAAPPLAARHLPFGPETSTLLINGSTNNAAAARVAQSAAFGNNRGSRQPLHRGSFSFALGDSALDARPFSFAGQRPDTPAYRDAQYGASFGGPLRMPGTSQSQADTFIRFGRSTDHQTSVQSILVPSTRERAGDFSATRDALGRAVTVVDPLSGQPFSGDTIPADRLSPEALALLAYYPAPNLDAGGRSNYQAPLVTATRQNNLEGRYTQNLNRRNSITGMFSGQWTHTDTPTPLGFVDESSQEVLNSSAIWARRFTPYASTRVRYHWTRTISGVTPFFADRVDVSGGAGIEGNDQDPANWGPPSLTFASGIAGLTTADYSYRQAIAHEWQAELVLNRPKHGVTMGAVVRQRRVDDVGQPNGRGTFGFTGDQSGSDLADFLLGLPHSSAITLSTRAKALHAWDYEAFISDDWRVTPALTLNVGVRWEFEPPMRELDGRLSNLDLTPDFAAGAVVTPSDPVGPLTGHTYPAALLEPDYSGIEPRIGVAWRPRAKSPLVVRGSYGVYRNRDTYQPLALIMARQPPFATVLSVESTAENRLTLANGFLSSAPGAPTTFAVEPDLKVGEAHNWQVSVQRELPGSLTVIAAYLGSAGRHLLQEFLPNTYPTGSVNPCPTCPAGFAFVASNGSSLRNALQLELRRRLSGGLTASAQYTLSKSTDDAAAFTSASLTGAAIAQDWRDLGAERARSNFDRRHQVTVDVQYSTDSNGNAWLKDWTVRTQVTAASGLPLTPIVLESVAGTGAIGNLRAALTGVSTRAPDGLYLNPAAYALPAPGQWGNAGRNSITGPPQFNTLAEIVRTFRPGDRVTVDCRLTAINVLNHVTYADVSTTIGSPQFGAPTRANPMRTLQLGMRLSF
jgi:hypothetical protein